MVVGFDATKQHLGPQIIWHRTTGGCIVGFEDSLFGFSDEVLPEAGLPAEAGLGVGFFLDSAVFPDIFSWGAGLLLSGDVVEGWLLPFLGLADLLEVGLISPSTGLSGAEDVSGDGLFLPGLGVVLLREPDGSGLLCFVVGNTGTPFSVSLCSSCLPPTGAGLVVGAP